VEAQHQHIKYGVAISHVYMIKVLLLFNQLPIGIAFRYSLIAISRKSSLATVIKFVNMIDLYI